MIFKAEHISENLRHMLRRAGRHDLLDGFELDDATLERSTKMDAHSADHAIYHALFDRGAPHAPTISPIAPPPSGAVADEVLKFIAEKHAETAALDRDAAGTNAGALALAVTLADERNVAGLEAIDRRHLHAAGLATVHAQLHNDATASLVSAVQEAAEQQAAATALDRETSHVNNSAILLALNLADEHNTARQDEAMNAAANDAQFLLRGLKALGDGQRAASDSHAVATTSLVSAVREAADRGIAARERPDRSAAIARWIQIALLIAILAAIFATRAHAQGSSPLVVQLQSAGSTIATRVAGSLILNCATATFVGNTWTCTSAGAAGGGGVSRGAIGANGASLPGSPTSGSLYLGTDAGGWSAEWNASTWFHTFKGIAGFSLINTANFAWAQQGTATATQVGPVVKLSQSATASDIPSFYFAGSMPATPYTISACGYAAFAPTASAAFANFGLALLSNTGSTSTTEIWGVYDWYGTNFHGLNYNLVLQESKPATWISEAPSGVVDGLAGAVIPQGTSICMAISDDGTNRHFGHSLDGTTYILDGTEAHAAITPVAPAMYVSSGTSNTAVSAYMFGWTVTASALF